MPQRLDFIGKVAVITGAGGGLGRAYALEFSKRGASVVVNDLGGSFHGDGKDTSLADKVVEEIITAGGKAVANYNSVEHGEKIIETAIQNYGKIDILVNNAGILRDRSFLKMSEKDWDKIFEVHVKGAFKVTKAAWLHMQAQKYGRIVMTTSPAGLYGNFGQANYSAAKMALVGLANTLSIEGRKKNIFVNTVAPLAVTRMTKDLMPGFDLQPEHVAPYVVFLCHESCNETGSIIEVAGGFACKTRLQRARGAQLRQYVSDSPSVETIANSWNQITDFSVTSNPSSADEAAQEIISTMQRLPEEPVPVNAPPHEKMMAYNFPDCFFSYTEEDVIQYALGVGATLPDDDLFLYEGHSSFSTLPTFAAIMGQDAVFGQFAEGIPGLEDVDVSRVLHGEQHTKIYKQIPPCGKVRCSGKIVDVLDKRKFCQVIVENNIYDAKTDDLLCQNQFVVLFVGVTGIGRRGKSKVQVPSLPPPARAADAVYEEKTSVNQAALYRLSGDKNPLHIDSGFSTAMGFETPILHGLCTYGYGLRHVLKTFADNDSSLCTGVKAQFSKPVLPGQTLQTKMWLEGRRVYFQTSVKENGSIVLRNAYVDFVADVQRSKSAPALVATKQCKSVNGNMKVVHTAYGIQLNKPTNVLSRTGRGFPLQVIDNNKAEGNEILSCTVNISESALAGGGLRPMEAFMRGELKASDKVLLTGSIADIFKDCASKL